MSRTPSMTRAHYQFIADVLRSARDWHADNESPTSAATVEGLALDFAKELRATNPRFDRARFLVACGL